MNKNNGISKIITLLQNTANHPSIIRTKSWIGINKDSRESYNTKANRTCSTK